METVASELPKSGPDWQQLRDEAGLTRLELAALTGHSVETIRLLEKTGRASVSTRRHIALVLGLRLLDLEDRETVATATGGAA
jgi:transcriptional regulator with XRE-family HTH domain